MTGEKQGRCKGSKANDMEFGQETQLQYNAFNLFDYGDAPPPLSSSPTSPCQAFAALQRNVEDDVSNGRNAPMGAMHRGLGR